MLSKLEVLKDTAQIAVEATATRIGRIAGIITGAVRDAAREIGGLATDFFEMGEAAQRARHDAAANEEDAHEEDAEEARRKETGA